MPVFLCRWPNGDVSLVMAESKHDAIWELDEVASAEPRFVRQMRSCMVHFTLTEAGTLELEGFGDRTTREIKRAYPILSKVQDLISGQPKKGKGGLRDPAVRRERERVQPDGSDPDEQPVH